MTETPTTEQMVPVSAERHAARRWRRFSSYAFARSRRHVPVVLGEHEQIAANMPLLFHRSAAGLAPVALLRVQPQGDSALVSDTGVWRGSYVPSILRVHPFDARSIDDRFELLIDEGSGLLTDAPEDERFFDAEGNLTPGLAEVVRFFEQRATAARRTAEACAQLQQAALLRDFPAERGLQGYLTLDRAALDNASRTQLSALHRAGALSLAHAHFVSLSHLGLLAHAEAQAIHRDQAPQPAQEDPMAARASERLSGFLDALADSQANDPFGNGRN